MAGSRLLYVLLALTLVVTDAHSLTADPMGPMVDSLELAESALAPFMAFTGGELYVSQQDNAHSTVCGHKTPTALPMVFPVTLRDLDRLHSILIIPQTDEEAELDMTEGCYLRRVGKDMPCVIALHSIPEDCSMNITESTNYWIYRRMTVMSSKSVNLLNGGSDLLVENVLQVQGLRERLRHSILRTREAVEAGKQLWEIVSQGWNKSNNVEAHQKFVEAVSARGASIVRQAYENVMDKWNIVRQWLRTSVGEIDIKVPTFTTSNGTLLSSHVYCNPSIYLDDWLNFFDEVMYGYHVISGIEREIEAFYSGHKVFYNRTGMYVHNLDRLPCITVSFAVGMMILEDFPVRLAYWDMVNETGSKNAPWPLKRFASLGDSEGRVSRNRNYLLNYYNMALSFLPKEPQVTRIFDGNVPLAACVQQAILRTPGPDGQSPPSSIYECISLLYDPSHTEAQPRGAPNITQSVIGLEKDNDIITVHSCPWGFVHPSGNVWKSGEDCVMCPPGSFDDGEGGCSCGADFYPGPDGCIAKLEMYTSSPLWEWRVDPANVMTANMEENSTMPFLIAMPPKTATSLDRVVLRIHCSEGLTQFEVSMPDVNGNHMTGNPTLIPLQRVITIVSSTNISLRIASSAAFGSEQCDFSISMQNPLYRSSSPLRAGTVIILPTVSEVKVYPYALSSDLSVPNSITTIISCDKFQSNKLAVVNVGVCSMNNGKLAVVVDAQNYTPFTRESFRIVKQAVWTEKERATELGNTMKIIADRIRLSIRMTLIQNNVTHSSKRVIHNKFPILNDIYKFLVLPEAPEYLTVEFQIVDRCATTSGAQDPDCANAKLLFAQSKVTTRLFELPVYNITEKSEDSEEEKKKDQSNKQTAPWWRVPLIVICVVDAMVFITAGVLLFIYLTYFRTATQSIGVVNDSECPHQSVSLTPDSPAGEEKEEEDDYDDETKSNESTQETTLFMESMITSAPY